jgi:hypothetical protein
MEVSNNPYFAHFQFNRMKFTLAISNHFLKSKKKLGSFK